MSELEEKHRQLEQKYTISTINAEIIAKNHTLFLKSHERSGRTTREAGMLPEYATTEQPSRNKARNSVVPMSTHKAANKTVFDIYKHSVQTSQVHKGKGSRRLKAYNSQRSHTRGSDSLDRPHKLLGSVDYTSISAQRLSTRKSYLQAIDVRYFEQDIGTTEGFASQLACKTHCELDQSFTRICQ